MELGKLGVWYFLDGMPAPQAAAAAKRIESLGYSTLWIPEVVGRHPFVHASWLLANTETLTIATGIANIYNREPGVTVQAQKTLAEQSNGRFLLGLGVSHKPVVEGLRKLKYGKPVTTMRKYLANMAISPFTAVGPKEEPATVIAALGPRMLELARSQCQGAHPYFTSPVHTKMARQILGPTAMLCVEQKVVLEIDPGTARTAARENAATYMSLPNYRNNWLRMGLNKSDIDIEKGGSDKFIDATFAWGSAEKIKERIAEHFDAGASHVCIQPVKPGGAPGELDWAALENLVT